MAEQIDYAPLLPSQPQPGALEWGKQKFTREYAIYKSEYFRDPVSGKKNGVKLTCTACHGHWYERKVYHEGCARYAPAPFGFFDSIEQTGKIHGERLICPHCGAELKAVHIGTMDQRGKDENVYFMEPWRLAEKFVLLGWRMERNTWKDGTRVWKIWPYEAYVFEKKKTVRLTGHKKWLNTVIYFDRWEQRQRCTDEWGKMTPEEWWIPKGTTMEALLAGSTIERAAFTKYLRAAGEKQCPVTYLRLWQKHRNLENLIVQGCGGMIAAAIEREASGYCYRGKIDLNWIDWKKKRPAQMLELNKDEFRACVGRKWTRDDLAKYKLVRTVESVDLEQGTKYILREPKWDLEKLCEADRGGMTVMRCLRYLDRQNQKAGYLLDYWNMARTEGIDLTDAHDRLPKNLQREHDRLVELGNVRKCKQKLEEKKAKIEARRPAFEKTVRPLECWAWESGGICIRPVRTEQELIEEGLTLHHCVGGYGKTVAEGKSCIFFIRRADAPEKSWYTLQVALATLKQIQNHGMRNVPATEEVDSFVKKWLEHVRQLCAAGKK